MSDWVKVNEVEFNTLKQLGAPTKVETTTVLYAKVPTTWNGKSITKRQVKPHPHGSQYGRRRAKGPIVFQQTFLKFQEVKRPAYAEGTILKKVLDCTRLAMQAHSQPKTREVIEKFATHSIQGVKRKQVSTAISAIVDAGYLYIAPGHAGLIPSKAPRPSKRREAVSHMRLGLGKVQHTAESQAGQSLNELKKLFSKGDMQKVLSRDELKNYLIETFHWPSLKANWNVSQLLAEGWLRAAGPEQIQTSTKGTA